MTPRDDPTNDPIAAEGCGYRQPADAQLHEQPQRHILDEAARFLIVGAVATLVALAGFNGLVHGVAIGTPPLRNQPLVAYALANAVAGCVAWYGMRRWAFDRRHVHDPAQAALRFFGLGALTMAVPFTCLGVSRYVLGLHDAWGDNLATIVGLGLGTAIRFVVFREHVFKNGASRSTA